MTNSSSRTAKRVCFKKHYKKLIQELTFLLGAEGRSLVVHDGRCCDVLCLNNQPRGQMCQNVQDNLRFGGGAIAIPFLKASFNVW